MQLVVHVRADEECTVIVKSNAGGVISPLVLSRGGMQCSKRSKWEVVHPAAAYVNHRALAPAEALTELRLSSIMMNRYLAQYADEAFKALLTEDDLKIRLDAADACLFTPERGLISAAPEEIRAVFAEVEQARGGNLRERANAIRRAIESILEEYACQTRQRSA